MDEEEALAVLVVEDSLKDLKKCQLSQNFLNAISILQTSFYACRECSCGCCCK
jgi:hypothetical protein